jgi:hypothetical protein
MKRVFDPRTNEYVESNNPALLLLDIIWGKFRADQLSNDIIPKIKAMADYCEEPYTEEVKEDEPR